MFLSRISTVITPKYACSINKRFPDFLYLKIAEPLSIRIRMSSSLTNNFQDAVKKLKNLKEDPGNDVKLNLYALYKQATEGSCTVPKPSVFDLVGKAKWDAWNSLASMSKDEAKNKYVALVNQLLLQSGDESNVNGYGGKGKYEGINYSESKVITEIIFDRPSKKNAITVQMYKDIISALKQASENETAVTILTGQGDYFSSGNDLSNFSSVQGDVAAAAKNAAEMLK
ncbi:Enoyl-CoA delta isomerase 2, mitochondrial, partial [Stegodyphus mimosarum]